MSGLVLACPECIKHPDACNCPASIRRARPLEPLAQIMEQRRRPVVTASSRLDA